MQKKKEEKAITLIALIVTIIVLLILAGVTIATLTGDNGLLQKVTSSKQANEEATALEKIQVEVAGSYGLDGKIDIGELNKNLLKISGLKYGDGDAQLSEQNKITKFPATVKLDGYLFEIEDNGKINKKTGIILNISNLSMAPGDKEILEVTFVGIQEDNITWLSDDTTVATVDNGEVTAVSNGTAKITATCGNKSATCKVTVASKLESTVNVGDYVDINIGYVEQKNSTDYLENKGIAWRVLSKDGTTGTVKLISTGHPLTYYHPSVGSNSGALSVTELKTIESGTIMLQTSSTSRGYQTNGFSQNNIADLFNNSSVFYKITIPARSDFANVDLNDPVRETGYAYWLAESPNDYRLYNGRWIWTCYG